MVMSELEETVSHLSELYGQSEIPVFFANDQLQICWSNDRAKQLFPFIDHKNGLYIFAPTLDVEKTLTLLRENRVINLDGTNIPLSSSFITLEPVFNGKELQGAVIFVNRCCSPVSNQTVVDGGDIVSLFSNQIRNPLSIIFSSLTSMCHKMDANGHMMYDQYIETINQNCYRILKSCIYISEITRYLNGINPLFLERVDICRMIAAQCEALQVITDSLEIPFEYSIPSSPIYTLCDVKKISLAVFNVVANSCKYTRPGNHINLTLNRSGSNLILSVSDNGIGISPEDMHKIFTPYFSVRDNTLSSFSTGLGLSLVKQVIAQHGGTIAVNSALGRGTSIAFTLPINDDDSYAITVSNHAADYFNDKFSSLYVVMADIYDVPLP